MGDPGFDVILANGTDQRVAVSVTGASSSPMTVTLGPREELPKTWFYPDSESDSRIVTVRATDASGKPVFCRQYGYRAIRDVSFRIEIQANNLSC